MLRNFKFARTRTRTSYHLFFWPRTRTRTSYHPYFFARTRTRTSYHPYFWPRTSYSYLVLTRTWEKSKKSEIFMIFWSLGHLFLNFKRCMWWFLNLWRLWSRKSSNIIHSLRRRQNFWAFWSARKNIVSKMGRATQNLTFLHPFSSSYMELFIFSIELFTL